MAKSIDEILAPGRTPAEMITDLRDKAVSVPAWGLPLGLESEYDPRHHPVMDRTRYPDVVDGAEFKPVTRVTCALQMLAVKRMSELLCGIPVKRVYSPQNDRQKFIASFMEAVYQRNRIDSVNTERSNMLFAGCEVLTLWYAVEQEMTLHIDGAPVTYPVKLRCRNFSPMNGDELYPLFDEYGDMTAMSVGYTRSVHGTAVNYFDAYTADRHIKWSTENGDWGVVEDERITLGKIPAVYAFRPTPIWEDTSRMVYEMEWSLSRNGNYLRENSKPVLCIFADEVIHYGDEKPVDREFRAVMQLPKGGSAQYVTWPGATDNLQFYVEQLRSLFFMQLQLPDWSYEKMSQQALSGESRKQMFIDAQLKVKDESGRWIEFFDRELNVVKAFAKLILGDSYAADIDALQIDTEITPFAITDESDTIDNLMKANGGEPIMSQRESIEQFGQSADVDRTLAEIQRQKAVDFVQPEPTV